VLSGAIELDNTIIKFSKLYITPLTVKPSFPKLALKNHDC